ncbi:MAG TPA: GDSL-type esterase/lipase family protein, partial [Clostridia bacterium]
IMPVGDSCTAGMGDPDMGSYRAELYNLLTKDGLSIDYVGSQKGGPSTLPDKDNEGHSGWTIPQISSNINSWLSTYNPDVVFLWIGGNDILQTGAMNPTGLSNLIDQILTQKPNVKLFVSDYYPWPESVKQYNAAIPGVIQQKVNAGKDVHFVKLSDIDFVQSVDLSSDGLHLNPGGYKKIAALWYKNTISILKSMSGITPTSTPTPTPTSTPVLNNKPGDLDSDGLVNSKDCSLMKRYLLGNVDANSINTKNADLNGDGRVNSTDYSLLRRIILGIFPTPTPTDTYIPLTPTPTPTPTATPTPSNIPTKVKGSDVLFIGDSFLALSRDIKNDLEAHAKSAGILASNDSFKDNSVSGTKLADSNPSPSIPTQYKNAGSVKYVIMDGGGNDCLWGSGPDAAAAAFKTLLGQMKTDGVVKLFYIFYPNPVNNSTLQGNLDKLRPQVVSMVTGSTSPKGYIIDLRPVFEGKYSQYILSDGIHPTAAGSQAAADAAWDQMQKVNFFSAN